MRSFGEKSRLEGSLQPVLALLVLVSLAPDGMGMQPANYAIAYSLIEVDAAIAQLISIVRIEVINILCGCRNELSRVQPFRQK
jgi:hypothetical protein